MPACSPIAWHPHPDARLEAAIAPADPPALEALLRRPAVRSDRYAHLRAIDRLHQLRPEDPSVLAGWVQAMLLSNRPAAVWAVARHWPLRLWDDPAWTLLAAQVAQVMGEADDARIRYRHLVEQYPGMVDAWQKYLDFEDPARVEAGDLARVEVLFQYAGDPYVREKAAFALAGQCSQQSPGRAFLLASEAHRLKRRRVGAWDADTTAHRLETDRRWRPLPDSDGSAPRPIFVVGLPRSGTTLLTRMLGSHSQVAGLGEQNLVPTLATLACRDPMNTDPRLPTFVQAWYRAAVGDLAGGARAVVDKLPANVEYTGLILAMFPDALVVHLQRELADCAMSIHLRDFEFGCLYADDPHDLAWYADQLGIHAQYWLKAAPGRILELRYEALVEDPYVALAPILAAAGLQWEPGMLDFWHSGEQIGTFSESQVRQPLHANSIGAWRRFLPEAGDHLRVLGVTV